MIIEMDLLFEIEEITNKKYKCCKADDEDRYVSVININELLQDLVEAYKRKE